MGRVRLKLGIRIRSWILALVVRLRVYRNKSIIGVCLFQVTHLTRLFVVSILGKGTDTLKILSTTNTQSTISHSTIKLWRV